MVVVACGQRCDTMPTDLWNFIATFICIHSVSAISSQFSARDLNTTNVAEKSRCFALIAWRGLEGCCDSEMASDSWLWFHNANRTPLAPPSGEQNRLLFVSVGLSPRSVAPKSERIGNKLCTTAFITLSFEETPSFNCRTATTDCYLVVRQHFVGFCSALAIAFAHI